MAVNLAASHVFFLSFSSSSSSFAPRQIQQNPSCSLGNLLKFPSSRTIPKNPISAVVRASAAAADAEAAVATGKEESLPPLEVGEIDRKCKKWAWRGYAINYFVYPEISSEATADVKPPLLLVHGFGASIAHWRRNIPTLAQSHTVYTIDLLGFGASDKPAGFQYTMEAWSQLILDFLDEVVQKPTVLLGNSVGSLACVIAAAESSQSLVRALVLLNCAGGMNNKAIVDDWRIKLFLPLLWLIDFLLKQRGIASYLFERARQRETLRNVLLSVYGNKEHVDEDLVEIIRRPALDEGALDAFVSIITGPPGPNPVQLMPKIKLPVLLLWGDQDPFTPIDGPVGKYFSSLPARLPSVSLSMLEGVGHCPHDDRPDLVHEKLLPWLAALPCP
ncbi:pheophytinase, chloroplastic [Salvia miltiorrhiza]|uniref:pheophytinase, chloroplastic n=1 Tax=Salvia miltiorrhiza TaxID=226208 RepID=UPI0025AD99AE|nr:pheophytinase, chloroplastic [Salvia miltiorrhiza]XP_057793644.1 pheophytinase, chloroplastic [Salvia miltiorrhiza]XP_057793645.1 pheophytinase, chloroplastic [Salvia miltiorrhiza]XP_057793646.1 pheophytinase, chloroplastic [Salvia miltiorrhiza]